MADLLSLGPVLDLIERWQQWMHSDPGIDYDMLTDGERAMLDVPISALKALAEQHAAQLREAATFATLKTVREDKLEWQVQLRAAADFLCAPRREPEAE